MIGWLGYDQSGYNRHFANANKSALGTFFVIYRFANALNDTFCVSTL